MEEHHVRARDNQSRAMDRLKQKHAREVKMMLDRDKVERDADLRSQTRKARQSTAQLEKVQAKHIVLTEELDSVVKQHNAMVKTMARERRQADVDQQTLYVNPFYPHPVLKLFELPSCCSHSPYIISSVGSESVVILRQV